MRNLKVLAPTFLIGACLITPAHASLVSYTISNPTSSSTGSGYADLEEFNVTIDNSSFANVFAGGIQLTESGGPVAGFSPQYTTVCTDIEGTLYLGQTYQYSGPTSFSGQAGIKPQWGSLTVPSSASLAIQNAAYLFLNDGGLTGSGITGTADQMAALQLAVWEALYNTTSSGLVDGSRFQVTVGTGSNGDANAVIAEAAALVASLNGNYGYAGSLLSPTLDPMNINSDGNPPQELLFEPVPEPSTILAGLGALLPFGASAVKILRKKFKA